MMHRFVAVIPSAPHSDGEPTSLRRAKARFASEALVLDTPSAAAWVFTNPPSQLGRRPLPRGGCLIGRDFRPTSPDSASLLQDTWGAYVAIVLDAAQDAVRVLRDPTGRIPCWRIRLPDADVLFSHYEDVYWLQRRPPEINWAFLAHYLGQEWLYGEETGLGGVTELLPGEELTYRGGKAAKRMRWWPHQVAQEAHPTLAAAQAAIRHAGEVSVSSWAELYSRVSIDLSGGLDSAIVLGLLRGVAQHPDVVGLNIRTPGAEGDERVYAQAAATLHGIPLRCRDMASDVVDFELRFPHKFVRPTRSLIPSGYVALRSEFARQEGTQAQFTGMGGDHLFYVNVPVAAVCDYLQHGGSAAGYFRIATYLAQLSRSTVWSAFAATGRHYLGRPGLPDFILTESNSFLTPEGRAGVDYERFAHPWSEAAVGHAPPAKLLQIVGLINLQTLYRRDGHAEISEEHHVLTSQPILEACLRTPAHWFGVGGIRRGLARRAFSDLLPPEIRDRRSKGGSSIYFAQFAARRTNRIRELLLDGRLVQKGLLDRTALERTLHPMNIASSKEIAHLLRCLRTELWVLQTEADHASPWGAPMAEAQRAAASA